MDPHPHTQRPATGASSEVSTGASSKVSAGASSEVSHGVSSQVGAGAANAELLAALAAARRQSDSLFELLDPAALYERAVAERHRFIFYLGHLEAFDWNLCRTQLAQPEPASELDRLFAFGIDPDNNCPQALPCDRATDWPALATVQAYQQQRRQLFDRHLTALPEQLLHVALEHRLMHAETLCYLLHWLPLAAKRALCPPQADPRPAPPATTVAIPAGQATLGRRHGFGWDNEFAEHKVAVPAFAIDKYKVTNGQYLRFVREGGPPPLFWQKDEAGDGFRLRCMFGEIPLPLSWPVYATHEQATAYARWAGRALPSEAQFHRAAFGTPCGPDGTDAGERAYPWGEQATPAADCGNFDFQRWDPQPVDATPAGDSAFGVAQLIGNGWEWTGTRFMPFAGFAPFPFYRGYSADFFDGEHFVLKGGSARTARCLLRRSFRNWFRPGYRYAYAGFRLVDP